MECPNEKELSSYLDKSLPERERQEIERHISGCDKCLDLLLVAYDADAKSRECPDALKEKLMAKFNLKKKKHRPELKWLLASILFFGLSFILKKYFLQFLIASAILGFKWALEGEGVKRAIMIFKGIEKKEKKIERIEPPPLSNVRGGDRYGKGD